MALNSNDIFLSSLEPPFVEMHAAIQMRGTPVQQQEADALDVAMRNVGLGQEINVRLLHRRMTTIAAIVEWQQCFSPEAKAARQAIIDANLAR